MKLHSRKSWITFGGLVTLAALTVIGPTDRAAAAPDWKAGEQAVGKAGTLMPGGVYRVGLPRTDFSVTVQGVRVEAPFALGSYAAFKAMGNQATVMGDLVLRDEEVTPFMTRLIQGGLQVTVLHNRARPRAAGASIRSGSSRSWATPAPC